MRRDSAVKGRSAWNWRLAQWMVGAFVSLSLGAAAAQPSLEAGPRNEAGWTRIAAVAEEETAMFILEASDDFQEWQEVARIHRAPFTFFDPASASLNHRFYRLRVEELSPEDDWKNLVRFPEDPFVATAAPLDPGAIRWVKFAIVLSDPVRVYFQDSLKYLFHYDFATARLGPFEGMSRSEFDAVSLRLDGQQVLLGAVLYPPGSGTSELGIQLVGLDPYPKEKVVQAVELVRSAVAAGPEVTAYYMPVFEQAEAAAADREYFADHGIELSLPDRWILQDSCYAPGWALGRLRFVSAEEIDAAYGDGRLLSTDILLTDAVPAEIPFVAGIITLTPSTPNSHVAILARSFGVPFVHIFGRETQDRLQQWVGREVLLRADPQFGACDVRVVDLEGQLSESFRDQLLSMKAPPKIDFAAKEPFGALWAATDSLTPADARFFGGKAANFGFLRRSIPDDSPEAIAISFNLWDAFMDQPMLSGQTLREQIQDVLDGYTYPPNINDLRADLATIRDWIEDLGRFSPEQQQGVIEALSGFDPLRKIRFRSSTNLEDTDSFSGAGLYDSYSGCLQDDLDSDSRGPSHCDPDQDRERGVFRAIRKVYASFYNENAFLERLRHGIDESQVGMALLVHHSFPDEQELANGVATMRKTAHSFDGDIVSQAGAVSVSNPDTTALPEVVHGSRFSFGSFAEIKQHSSLVPLGGTVMDWDVDYRTLIDLMGQAADAYHAAFPDKESLLLDFEFKKIVPGKLVVKQIREVPLPSAPPDGTLFLLNEPGAYCVFQGEYGDVFANHRLKSRWQVQTHNRELTPDARATPLLANLRWEYQTGGKVEVLEDGPENWPEAAHSVSEGGTVDSWSVQSEAGSLRFRLLTDGLTSSAPGGTTPLLLPSDLNLTLEVEYPTTVPAVDFEGQLTETQSESVRLVPCPKRRSDDVPQTREFVSGDGVRLRTDFIWPRPQDFGAGYTAPLVDWDKTVVEGLTSEPFTLTDWYAQTYRPEHHNFAEHFVFEPRLDPNLPPSVAAELIEQDVQLIYVYWDGAHARIQIMGADGRFRQLPTVGPKAQHD